MFFQAIRFPEINELHKELENFLYNNNIKKSYKYPPVNIQGSKEEVIVTAELPGLSKEQIDISVVDNVLTISGKRELETEATFFRQERSTGEFKREIQLPFKIDTEKVSASYNKGILSVKLLQREEDKPKKIQIQIS